MRNIEELKKRKLKSTLTLVSFSFHLWVGLSLKENLGNTIIKQGGLAINIKKYYLKAKEEEL
jgi:hypothetical protein